MAKVAFNEDARAVMLASQVARVEAVRAIKRLQHAHSHYVTAAQWDAAAALFSQRGELARGDDVVVGRQAIADYLRATIGDAAHGRLFAELVMTPVVTLSPDGETGRGRWHEMTIDAVAGLHAGWTGGIQENEYVREDGVWRIARLHYHPQYAGPYAEGWHGLTENPQLIPYHYDVAQTGTPVSTLAQDEVVAGTACDTAELAARLARLEDETAIQNLQNAWGYYVDRRQWDDIADLYAPDGLIALANDERVRGRSAIRSALEEMGPAGLSPGELNDHLLFAPVVAIHADGSTASARGLVLGTIGVHQQDAQWTLGIYDNDYVKRDGIWMIAASRYYPRAATDYYRGWAESQIAAHAGWTLATNMPEQRFPACDQPAIRFPHPVAGTHPAPATASARQNDLDEMAQSVTRAAAVDAVENIACAYGYYIDEFRWHEVGELFSTHGWKELSYIGIYKGRERVLGSLIARYGDKGRVSSFLAIHQKIQPVVTIAADGLSARIHLRLFQVGSLPSGPGPFIGGVYEDEAVLEDGIWKISGMDLDYIWFAGYAEGWGKADPQVSRQFAPKPGSMDHYPPDGPLRGPAFAPFPAHEPLPIHFCNPVSGRKPPPRIDQSA